jgi:hypothetical protein
VSQRTTWLLWWYWLLWHLASKHPLTCTPGKETPTHLKSSENDGGHTHTSGRIFDLACSTCYAVLQ